MDSLVKSKVVCAFGVALACLLAVPVPTWGVGLSVTASIVTVTAPPPPIRVTAPPPPIRVTAPPLPIRVTAPPPPITVAPARAPVTAPVPSAAASVRAVTGPLTSATTRLASAIAPVSPAATVHTTTTTPLATATMSSSVTHAASQPYLRAATRLPLSSAPSGQVNPAGSRAQGSAAAAPPSSGYGSSGGARSPVPATPHALPPVRQPARARPEQLSLRTTVRRLARCLADLPDHLRLVLELRTGIDVPRPLGLAAIAERLHLSVGEIPAVEKQALRRLRLTAGTHSCGRATQAMPDALVPSGVGSAPGGTAGGEVEAVRYAKSPSQAPAGVRGAAQADPLLGVSVSSTAGYVILVIAIVMGVLVSGALFADQVGSGPRHRDWRGRSARHRQG
jgi:sigma-70-like protein